MAVTNHERVGKALDLLKNGLRPFFERELKARYGNTWHREAVRSFKDDVQVGKEGQVNWDVQKILLVMWDQWNEVFRRTLGQAERTLVSELRETRNNWAHQNPFSTDDAYRAMDSIGRLLQAVSAEEVEELEKYKMELLRTRFDEQRRGEMRKTAVAPVEGRPAAGLKPWREIVAPHPDVASGHYQQAEFAADLWQVYLKEGTSEYRNPSEFFRRTFLTEGLKHLLITALRRLSGTGGDPVVELQTNFGGGKTHSMLALYHLFSGTASSELAGVEDIIKEAGTTIPKEVKRAVLVGTKISPGTEHKKPDGTIVRTLWGELAWQLGGKEGYNMVKDADRTATNPGDILRELFNRYSPCLILIDEWVAYARQLHDDSSIPAGTFDTQFTFAQALTEAAKSSSKTILVVSIPSSINEIGGEQGQNALDKLKNAVGRVESSWRPASPDEGFEIVRRRLFEPIVDNKLFVQRDAVARAFTELYTTQRQEFPSDCCEGDYERRIKAAYPIHPELFDRLFNDWSTLDKFQRTRGVLRLMAAVIHTLWSRQDGNLLIMPSSIPIDDAAVQFELTRYMEDQWVPVIEKDVDGPHSLPLRIDGENPNLGRYSACRRVARTIYIGSAPLQRAANRGIDDRRIKLGCVQPGETVATFGDALRRLTEQATFLYVDGAKCWYSTQPSVNRLADDRANQFKQHNVYDEIIKRLHEEARSRSEFSRVHACVPSADIPDEQDARLVILGPQFVHMQKDLSSTAVQEAAAILESRGASPRSYKNALIFLAADSNRLKELESACRQFMAWAAIIHDRESLNLDAFQSRQADTRKNSSEDTVKARIKETFQWLLIPCHDTKGAIEWSEIRLQGQDDLALRAVKKLKNEELLLIQMGGTRLRLELDKIPLWRGDHVGVKQLAEDFAKYTYLPRLKDSNVLISAVRDGIGRMTWETETFAYADSWDETNRRYLGLQVGMGINVVLDSASLLVKPEVAKKQMNDDAVKAGRVQESPAEGSTQAPLTGLGGSTGSIGVTSGIRQSAKPKRFHATKSLDPTRLSRDAQQIAEEVVQRLASLDGAEVEVHIELQIKIPNGTPVDVVRTVTENCRTLNFENYEFESE